ncbi:MAG: hypothetical protein U0520_04330 [Candidatus Saccharimonadales bacterium]
MALREMLREGATDLLGLTKNQRVCNAATELGCAVMVQFDTTISNLGRNALSGGFTLTALTTKLWPIIRRDRGLSQSCNGQHE